MMLDLLRNRGRDPVTFASWDEFLASDAPLGVAIAELGEGVRIAARKIRVITATELGMERPKQRQRRRRARDPEAVIRELTDLHIGAPVVHEDHGVGRYRGLTTLDVDGVLTEFLLLEYAGGDKLYVPVQSLHLVTRYSGAAPEDAPLHRLGSDQWAKAKRKAAEQARDTAAELLNLYAQRAARTGTQLALDAGSYQRFALEFPFEETEDQLTAIERVLADLASERPMDRVVCGDVGFGKTEVALRSAFVAVQAGYQVAVLVPTTLLAEQHYRTFKDRFAEWPVRVELLSRFRSAAGSTQALAGLADGQVDIVIGTHKLLQPDLKFKRLGLVIVDEEHRFGVKHKERLKRLRAEVDMLTLTATPIPRTLNMTLGGLRDLSIIATPPADRLAVKTFVGEWSDRQIREAVLREIRRGGQIYFVHNRVENIESVAEQLRKLLPEADVRVAHGQMSERELEVVMLDFYHRQFNVLVCTTIIESGIDIPTANTIIINRADHFGLAQLHQLRGRVGRSHHQAYAYLVAPPMRALSADAVKRLEAIESLEELGSGFALATHDLEIRGAGELLGEGQSGQIQAIGFTLYNELLGRAVAALREGREPDLEDPFTHGPEIEIGVPALIPEDYMPDVHMRLVHYKRIANAASQSRARRAAGRAHRPLRPAAAAAESPVRDHLAQAARARARDREDPGIGGRRQRALRGAREGGPRAADRADRRRPRALSPRRAVQAEVLVARRGRGAARRRAREAAEAARAEGRANPRPHEMGPRYTGPHDRPAARILVSPAATRRDREPHGVRGVAARAERAAPAPGIPPAQATPDPALPAGSGGAGTPAVSKSRC